MRNNRRNGRLLRLTLDAMLIALYVVLSFFASVRIPPLIKISWASLPLLVAALLFSPADAIAVAFCGTFLEQLLSYGITPTTPIWMAPPVFHVLFVALLAPFCRRGNRRVRQTVVIAVSELFLTLINTAALYLDAAIVGYSLGAITAILPPRLLNGAIRAVLSSILVPMLLMPLTKLCRRMNLSASRKPAYAEMIAYVLGYILGSGASIVRTIQLMVNGITQNRVIVPVTLLLTAVLPLIPVLLVHLLRLLGRCVFCGESADRKAIAYIHAHPRHPEAVGLSRIRELLGKCHNPQDGMRFVHIAGTNGKGSVSAMTAAVLQNCGYRTGLFTSPYLREFNERIRVCGKPIPPRALARLVEKIRPIADAMATPPTEFELITAIGFLYFKEKKCDVVVLEVGLGGRLDPTNVIENPALCVITGIAMDHTAVLGDTVEQIAAEKAGIIKHGIPVVWGGENETARRVIEEAAQAAGAPCYIVADTPIRNAEFTLSGVTMDFGAWRSIQVPLLGVYQARNLATVLKSVEILQRRGFDLPEEKVRRGLSSVRWEGRFEKLRGQPPVFFDGAHNPQGIAAAREGIECYFPGEKILVLTGVMADKDHGEMVKCLAPIAARVFTVTPENPRALPAGEFAAEWQAAGVPATAYERIGDAVFAAVAAAKKAG